METRTTIRTIERGVRVAKSTASSKERSHSRNSARSSSPIEHVKQQLQSFVDHSHLEKNEMHKLNDRMSTYLNRVKALEGENTKLMRDIGDLQCHWGDETRNVREHYEQSLFDLRTRIDDAANLKTVADVRHKRAQYENCELQKRLDDTARYHENEKTKIKNLERELVQLRENNENMKKAVGDEIREIEKNRQMRDDTWANLVDLLDKLDDELFRRIAVEYNNQTLREHIEFVKQVNEREIAEMAQLGEALPFNDQIEFYKDQLKRVIANIRKDYEQLHMEQTREMEEWMRIKTEELAAKARERDPMHDLELGIQLENMGHLRETFDLNLREMDDLRRQHEIMSKRLQAIEEHVEIERAHIAETLNNQDVECKKLNEEIAHLMDDTNHINANKATLEYEMQVYKRLLDSQLNSLAAHQDRVVPAPAAVAVTTTTTTQQRCLQIDNQTSICSSNAFGGKVQNKKEKKGCIGISDSSPDGKYIIIENVGGQQAQVDLSGWIIKRKVDGNTELAYRIPSGVILPSNKEL